jgi:hypothetical protein
MSSFREPARRGERGAVSGVTLLLVAALACAGYMLRVWGPIYLVHLEVKQVVRDFGNRAIKNPKDAELLEEMCQKIRTLDTSLVLGPDGTVERRPSVDVHPQEVLWERDTSAVPPVLRVAFAYRRDVHYPILDLWREADMQVEIQADLTRADWGKP